MIILKEHCIHSTSGISLHEFKSISVSQLYDDQTASQSTRYITSTIFTPTKATSITTTLLYIPHTTSLSAARHWRTTNICLHDDLSTCNQNQVFSCPLLLFSKYCLLAANKLSKECTKTPCRLTVALSPPLFLDPCLS